MTFVLETLCLEMRIQKLVFRPLLTRLRLEVKIESTQVHRGYVRVYRGRVRNPMADIRNSNAHASMDLGQNAREPGMSTRFLGSASVDRRPMFVVMLGRQGSRFDISMTVLGSPTIYAQVTTTRIVYIYLRKPFLIKSRKIFFGLFSNIS